MKLPINWMKDFLNTKKSIDEIASTLTLAGLEVDGILGTSFNFSNVVTAKVIETQKHPESEKLQLAKVDTGTEIINLICGASNCKKGMVTALALIGAKLKLLDGSTLEIKKSIIRNVESNGMLCSKEELGLETSSNGIIEFPSDTKLGKNVADLLIQPVLDISLTPNLGHCFSVFGCTRELSYHDESILKKPTDPTNFALKEASDFSISIESSECEEFHLAKLNNIQIQPSPDWLKERLQLVGMKSINNVVDALNYTMIELGQPLHAYDFDKLPSKNLRIKECQHLTSILSLDSVLREIPKSTLVVQSGEEIAAVAGIIGSSPTMVTESTKTILIEAAHFDSKKVRQGMKHLHLRTEAGAHFEKGIDRNMTKMALLRACSLILESQKGDKIIEIKSEIKTPISKKTILFRFNIVEKIIGINLSQQEIIQIFEKIDCKITNRTEDSILLEIPSYRNDIQQEIDLVEEIARLFGFNNIEKSQGFYRTGTVDNHPIFVFEQKIKSLLISLGLQEFITCNLISPQDSKIGLYQELKESDLISVLHAKSIDQSILRPSFIPSFLKIVKNNLNFQTKNLFGFEIGRVHFYDEGKAQEKFAIGLIITGKQPDHFSQKGKPYDFYDLKGILESILDHFEISYELRKSSLTSFHPGQQAAIYINKEPIAFFGQLHPNETKKLDIDQPIFFAQIDLHHLMAACNPIIKMHALPDLPGSTRDITLKLNNKISYMEISKAIEDLKIPILKKIECIDIFSNDSIGKTNKNVTLRFTYRSDEKTLDTDTIELYHQKVTQTLYNFELA